MDKFSTQVEASSTTTRTCNHVLQQLRAISDVLRDASTTWSTLWSRSIGSSPGLGEGLASGPFFKAMLVNLLPYWVLQPWVDAAFKKRGIDPEQFWRSAGLPAFRFPDPNGARLPNGAPPPAPPALEGTPDHPGPAVPPGSPCSYTPPADGLPRPRTPLPCAARPKPRPVRSAIGPSPGAARRVDLAAEPNGRRRTGSPDRRTARRALPSSGRTGAAAAERAAGRPHREPGTGRSGPAPVDVRAGTATGTGGAAGTWSAIASGRDTAAAGQPTVPPAGIARAKGITMSTIFNIRNMMLPHCFPGDADRSGP